MTRRGLDEPHSLLPVREPIGRELEDSVDEARIQRLFRGAEAKMERSVGQRAGFVRWAVGSSLVLALAALLLVIGFELASEPLAVTTSDGKEPAVVAVSERAPESKVVRFDDGSMLKAAPGTTIIPTLNRRAQFTLELAQGDVELEVEPRSKRTWTIDAGIARVTVLGTRLLVKRHATGVEVKVSRGKVRVTDTRSGESTIVEANERVRLEAASSETRSEAKPDSDARKEPNTDPDPPTEAPPEAEPEPILSEQSIDEPEPVADSTPTQEEARASESATRSPNPMSPSTESSLVDEPRATEAAEDAERVARTWQELARKGDHAAAYKRLGSGGSRAAAATLAPAELLLLADVARLSGHPRDAVYVLERMLSKYPGDSRTALAAVLLGRVEMDDLGRRERARAAFERAMDLGVPVALQVDVRNRMQRLSSDRGEP